MDVASVYSFILRSLLGQEIYKEFDYFIRFLHHRVLKVRQARGCSTRRHFTKSSVGKTSIAFNAKVKI